MALLVIGVLFSLGGCTSGWRAPLETRSSEYSKRQAGQPPAPGATRYKVRRGDTLYAIAWRSNNDFRDLARWNGIRKPYTIYAGQVLRLRPPKSSRRSSSSTSKSRTSKSTRKTSSSKSTKKQTRKTGSASKTRKQTAKKAQKKKSSSSSSRTAYKPSGKLRWAWPVNGKVKSTFKRGDALRKGIKVAGKPGNPIRAAEGGKVVYSGSGLIGYGRLIIVKHNDKYLSAYGHNRKLLAKQGQQVTKGQKIAELGTSNDGTPLLHFEIRRNGKPVNPLALLPRR